MSICKYCLENCTTWSPCLCKNNVHYTCLLRWFWGSGTHHCPECKYDLIRDNTTVRYFYFFTQGCLFFMEFCEYITTQLP